MTLLDVIILTMCLIYLVYNCIKLQKINKEIIDNHYKQEYLDLREDYLELVKELAYFRSFGPEYCRHYEFCSQCPLNNTEDCK